MAKASFHFKLFGSWRSSSTHNLRRKLVCVLCEFRVSFLEEIFLPSFLTKSARFN